MNSSSCRNYQENLESFILLSVLSTLSGIVSVAGNFLVLWTIFHTKSLHVVSNWFIASLAAADLLVGLLLNPFLSVIGFYRYKQQTLPSAFDTIQGAIWVQSILITTYSFASVSYDRFYAITKPLHYKEEITSKKCAIAIASIWILSSLFSLQRVFVPKDYLSILWLTTVALAFIPPLTMTLFCYYFIFKSAKYQRQRIASESVTERKKRNEILKNRKTAFTVAIIIVVFSVLFVPSQVVSILDITLAYNACLLDEIRVFVWPWVSFVALVSSAVNPWILSLRSRHFRQAIKYSVFNTNMEPSTGSVQT
ncbi:trace amine-associated receptor 6-like [Nematostella vectensis]|uniref:trace amine-associated receptor 6-like n=1 Tax=Nematostella vectensis TaxID=45351 RepID=UPI0020770AE7|nr:trace amine-associated receptor 6-like [Nematostella vectensis]